MPYPKELQGILVSTNVPCGECGKPLMKFPTAGAMFCFTVGCPGHRRRSIINFPTLRCPDCGLTNIVRKGTGSPAECMTCPTGVRMNLIPEVLRGFIPQEESAVA
jgi:ribosomal protein S27E